MRLRPVRFRSSPRRCRHGDRGAARSLGMREGSVRPRVTAPIRCRPMAGRWPLDPAIEVRILAPERCIGRQAARHAPAKRAARVRFPPDARRLGRRIGLGSSKPDGRVRLPDELRLRGRIGSGAAVLTRRKWGRVLPKARRGEIAASVRGRDPSLRSSVSWFESSQRHECSRGLTVRAALFQGANAGSIPVASTKEGEVCVVQTPVPKTGRRESVRVRLLRLPLLEDRSRSGASAVC